jgi:murein DD-endopeptidase MepM/ murein hydrolase activator NlpD
MAGQPFTIQSPEEIAKDYGGNKQKIAEAMQMGIVDPTAGTLAGMFIDRMRSAAQTEAAPQQTVAQQVFAPPAPPQPPMGAPAGLGATPQAAAMPPMDAAPQMGMAPQEMPPQEMAPQEMPSMAEGGMVPPYASGGGLSELPIPDTMFDEPGNGGFDDGYAGGGMVAFGKGGDISPTDWMRSSITSPYGVKRSTGTHQGLDFGVGDKTPIGVPAPGKVIKASTDNINGNFVIVEHPDGTRSSYSHLSEFNVEPGQEVGPGDVIGLSGNTGRVSGKNGGYHLHFGARDAEGNRMDPTEFFKNIAPQVASGKFKNPKELVDAAQGDRTLYGMPTNLRGTIDMLTGMMPEESAEDIELRKELAEKLSPESRAQAKKDAFFAGLGDLSQRIAESKDKSTLGSVLGSLGGGAADISKRLDEEEKDIREMQRERSQLANLSRKEKIEVMGMGVDLTGKVAQLNEGIESRKAELEYKKEALKLQRDQLYAEIAAAQNKGLDVDQMVFQMFLQGGPLKEAAKEYLGARYKGIGEGEAELFGDKLKGKQTEKQNPAFRYQ